MIPSDPENPEQRARRQIDAMLVAAGWDVQDRATMNLAAAPGVALREFQTSAGPADYLLFLGNRLVGVVEAKKAGVTLSTVEAQTRDYAAKAPKPLQVPVRPLPFLYESTGVETWFTNGLDPDPTARRVFSFHRPEALRAWLDAELDRRAAKPGAPPAPTLKGRMRLAAPLNTAGMWPAQIRAVQNLEASFRDGKPRALVQMATGSGKTFTAISAIYLRVIPDADFQAVTPDARHKTHFVVVDCVGVMEEQKADPPLDRERGISFPKLLELVRAGNRDEDVLAALAARLDRMDRRLTPVQREQIEAASGGVPLRDLVAGILDRLDPDAEDARARQIAGLPDGAEVSEAQVQAAQQALREEAAAPIAYDPRLCEAMLEVRKAQEVTLDVVTLDEVTRSGARADLAMDHDADKALIGEFEAFCQEHKDAIDALMVLYDRPYAQRLTRKQLMELVAAIQRPPRQWTGEALWAAYERVEKDRVRGASRGRLLTDLISLARHAMGVEPELVSYADQAAARFTGWLRQQEQQGRSFTYEQLDWLRLIRDRIVVDLEVRLEDFDETPFAEKGGLGKVWGLFGEELEGIVGELNRELVA